jgi:hypothetical protein
VLAGFLRNGSPSAARVISKPHERTQVYIYAPVRRGSMIVMVGQPDAKEQLWSALHRVFAESPGRWFEKLAGTIHYLCKHEGVRSIGGAPSIAVCSIDETMFWPFISVDSRLYYRGLDVTACDFRPEGRNLVAIEYDEGWHAVNDQERRPGAVRRDEGFVDLSCYLEDIIQPSNIFKWADRDPKRLEGVPDPEAPAGVNVIIRPGDLSWFVDGAESA